MVDIHLYSLLGKKHWRIVSNKQKSEMLLDHWQSIISVSTPTYFIYQLFIIYSVNYLSSCTFETFFFFNQFWGNLSPLRAEINKFLKRKFWFFVEIIAVISAILFCYFLTLDSKAKQFWTEISRHSTFKT